MSRQSRQGLERTPMRVAKAYKFFTAGYHQDLQGAMRAEMLRCWATCASRLRHPAGNLTVCTQMCSTRLCLMAIMTTWLS